jgi:glycosyltransferase involved in cell wall biosynthesis
LAKKYNPDWNNMKINNQNKIAVITPVYNDIEHIFHVISSVKSQSISNIVHYIYDDASTDGLYEGIKDSLDSTLIYLRGEKNQGQSHARNVCIKKAIQDGCNIIAFLDSDDIWYPNHLQLSIPDLNDYDIVYSKPDFVDENNNNVIPVNIPVPDIFVGKQLLHNNFIWISSVVARTSCFEEDEFDGTLNSLEDWDMWIRLWKKDFTFTDKQSITTRYLVRNNSQAKLGLNKIGLFKSKHETLDKLKLHLACGHDYNPDYINVDLYAPDDAVCDVRFDVQKLPYPDNSVDEIKAFHIIEHFHFFEIKDVLNEWFRVLKPGGKLYLETPDFLETCRSFVEGSPVMPIEEWRVLLYGHFFAHPWVPGQTHKFLFTESQLKTNLSWAGFKRVDRVSPASKYVMEHTKHLFLTVEAYK